MRHDIGQIRELTLQYVGTTGGLIKALHVIQGHFRCLPNGTDAVIADAFNLSRAEVKGVISFYHDFKRHPRGRTVVRVCAAEACQAVGGRELAADLENAFALRMGDTREIGDLTLEAVYCLGLCSCAPSVMVDDKLLGRANVDKVVCAVERAKKEQA